MEIIGRKSRDFRVNLFADFILSKIPKEESSIINIVDFGNFWVVKGKTSHNDLLDIPEIKNEFISKYSEYFEEGFIFQTIDLIEYESEMKELEKLKLSLFNSDNCLYHQTQIDEYNLNPDKSNEYNYELSDKQDLKVHSSSNFPYGYSLKQGRLLLYLMKQICYTISKSYYFEVLNFELHNKNNDENLKIYNPKINKFEDFLVSSILDVYDFNFKKLEKNFQEVDFCDELLRQTEEYDFLKNSKENIEMF